MSDRQGESNGDADTEPAPQAVVGWFRFHGRPVMLQMRAPVICVKHPNHPVRVGEIRKLEESEDPMKLAHSSMLGGILYVEPDGQGGAMLILETPAPPDGRDLATIAIHQGDVYTCQAVEQRRIISSP